MINETTNLVSPSENQQSDAVSKNNAENSKNGNSKTEISQKYDKKQDNFHFNNYEESNNNPSKRLKIDEEQHNNNHFQAENSNSNLQTLQPANVKLEQQALHFGSTGQSSSSGTSSAYVSPNNTYGFNPYGIYVESG